MKSKNFTYFLGFAVLLIWGLIIYKILKAVSAEDEPVVYTAHPLPKEPLADYAIPKDTARLSLNYRDPFAEKKAEPAEIPVSKIIAASIKPLISRPLINWSAIRYSGFIHNTGSKKLIAILSVNGKEIMLSEGETAGQVRLIKNLKDSVKLSYQGATKFIILNKAL